MSIKSDRWIRRMASEHAMIEPCAENQARAGVNSYGVSSYGYDMRVAPEFKIFTNVLSAVVDPKEFDSRSLVEFEGGVHRTAKQFRPCALRRVFPDPPRGAHDLRRQEHLREVRHHHQR